MFNNGENNNSMGPADFAAMMGNFGGGNWGWGGNMFGNDIWGFFLIALLFGMWGGNGWGNWGNNGGSNNQAGFYATQADLQRGFDQAALTQQVGSIATQLDHVVTDPGYMITNSFNQAELSRANNQAALLQQMNSLAMGEMQDSNATQALISGTANQTQMSIMQSANQEQANTAQIRYDMATSDCAIKTAIANAVTTITQNDNANYRQLHDEMVAERFAAKDAQIQALRDQNAALNLAQSQANQNQYLIDQLRPAAVPSYTVPNPYYGYGFQCCGNTCCGN